LPAFFSPFEIGEFELATLVGDHFVAMS